jgi:hypothetical protein
MNRMRGWGLLLAVAVPLLIFFSWSRLGGEKARINLDRYSDWSAQHSGVLLQPLAAYFLQHKKLATPEEVTLPPVPQNSGIKRWTLQPDGTLLVELDAAVEGRTVQLRYVPLVRSASGIFYDCVSATSPLHVGRFCQGEVLKTEADIPAQLQANTQALQNLPPVLSASGVDLPAGAAMGSVVVVPTNPADMNHCGYQCVQPQSCVTPRPLACGRTVDEGNSRHLDVSATPEDFRGNQFATRSAADAACAQTLGAGYRVVNAASLGGVFKLTGGNEYWVHHDLRSENNCWASDVR